MITTVGTIVLGSAMLVVVALIVRRATRSHIATLIEGSDQLGVPVLEPEGA